MKHFFDHVFKEIKHFYVAESQMVLNKLSDMYNHCSNVVYTYHDPYWVYIIIFFVISLELVGYYKKNKSNRNKEENIPLSEN